MEMYGARVIPSPSPDTNAGRAACWRKIPNSPGSLGIAISEAVEDAATRDDTKYSLGSVLNHVLMHQTVIGQEAQQQMEMAGDYPDVVIGCVGGGSNFAGLAFPFVGDKLTGKAPNMRIVAVEPAACPTLTRGVYAYDFGDTAGMAPLVKMHTLGHSFVPPAIHAGGLRYHGVAPAGQPAATRRGCIEAVRLSAEPGLRGGRAVRPQPRASCPRPKSAHAIRAAIDEALRCKEAGEAKTILFNLSGHGHLRPGRLRPLPGRRPGGLRVPGGRGAGGAGRAALGGGVT